MCREECRLLALLPACVQMSCLQIIPPGRFAPTQFTQHMEEIWPWGVVSPPGSFPPVASVLPNSLGLSPSTLGGGGFSGSEALVGPLSSEIFTMPKACFCQFFHQFSYPVIPNTGYNSVARGALPYRNQSLPLGDHLLPATIEKNLVRPIRRCIQNFK